VTELVLDANTLMRGRGNLPPGDYITTPEVAEELKSQHSQNIYNNKDITVQTPDKEAVEKVNSKAEEINSPTSEADNSIVALALERDSKVVSDDKGVQNLCLWLDVDFQDYMREEVDERMKWERVCVDCGSEVSGDKCSTCGSSNIERKPV
jgi:rRNA maturation endonuclease Nob1